LIPDLVLDDIALANETDKSFCIVLIAVFVIYVNTQRVTEIECIAGILGDFYIFETNLKLAHTIDYLYENKATKPLPIHCVSFKVKSLFIKK